MPPYLTLVNTRTLLEPSAVHPAVQDKIANYQSDLLDEVRQTIASNAVVGMAQNPFVKKARASLKKRGITFAYLEYGSYLSAWRRRLAIKMWTGWPTFPMIFVDGTFIGGHADLERLAESGELDSLMSN